MNENDAMRRGERPDLEEALRALPRVEASEDFTARVLEASGRSDRGLASSPWLETLAKAAGVLALCGAAMFAGWWWTGKAQSPGAASRQEARLAAEAKAREIERLQTRMQTLQVELEELRRLASEAQPIVPLGTSEVANGEPVDYYLDLRALRSVQPEAVRTTF